jgi:AraC family transcriptional regulator
VKVRTSTLEDYKQRLLRVLLHIQLHLDEPLALAELARCAHFSPYHFHRVFKGMIGESVQSHIRRLRLERAAGRLKLGRQPVMQIALEAGYDTHEAFSRAFKGMFGVPPSGFRAANGLPGQQPGQPARTSGQLAPSVPSGVHYQAGGDLKRFRAKRPGDRAMQVIIKTIAPMRVAFVRHIGTYDTCGAAWDRL